MRPIIFNSIIFAAFVFSACSNQRQVTAETDDVYFSQKDRALENATPNSIGPSVPNEFAEDEGYFVKGSSRPTQSASQEESYFSQEEASALSQNNANGGTVNNFYGTTNYYEDDGFGTSYATNIRRFNSTNVIVGYGFYDPFFVDPYWNYGWSYWNPWYRPRWNVGWSSWGGWYGGYGWGAPMPAYGWYGGGAWGYSCWPYCNSMYGMGVGAWNNPYAYNNYWNGYNNGYWNGYNDGVYSNFNNVNQRSVSQGRRGLANETGFVSSNTRNNNPNNAIQSRTADMDRAGMVEQNTRTSPNAAMASTERLNQVNQVYRVPAVKATAPATNQTSTTTTPNQTIRATSQPNVQPSPRIKYEASELARTPVKQSRYPAASPNAAPGNSQNPSNTPRATPNSPAVQTPGSGNNPRTGSPNAVPAKNNYYRAPERQMEQRQTPSASPAPSQQPTRINNGSTQPARTTNPSDSRINQQPAQNNQPSYTPPVRNGSYQAPSNRTQSPNRSVAPSRSPSPSPSRAPQASPSRSPSPAPSRSVSPSPSRGGMQQAPSRSSSPSRGGSPAPGRR